MGYLLYLPPALVALFTLYYITTQIRYSVKARRLGCKPAPLFRPWDFFGIQTFRIEINGLKTHQLSHAFTFRKEEMSQKLGRECKTFRIQYPPGETWIYTFDPRNLQAVLATQFQDFQQPYPKVGALQPLLGPGIVCCNSSLCCFVFSIW